MYDILTYIMEFYEIDLYSHDGLYFLDLSHNGSSLPPVTITKDDMNELINSAYVYVLGVVNSRKDD